MKLAFRPTSGLSLTKAIMRPFSALKMTATLRLVLLLATSTARAALFTDSNINQEIPDGGGALNTLSRTISVSGLGSIVNINVILNISGGANSDIYAILRGPGGVSAPFAVLLNRVGTGSSTPTSSAFGYLDSGFSITLSSSASYDIHWYQQTVDHAGGQLTGTWQADGRAIDPNSSPGAFDTASRSQGLDQFVGFDPNGEWTITFSDWVTSGDPSTLISWSLDIQAVPEPINMALAIFGGLGVIGKLAAWRCKRRRAALD